MKIPDTDQQFIEEAGAIVIRGHNRSPEVLLILSRKKPQVRIFPKGHMEPGESAATAAKRELLEEAGLIGNLKKEAGTVVYEFRGKKYRVVYYLFSVEKHISNGEEGRDPCWFSLENALTFLPFDELRDLLQKTAKSYTSE
jgi:deoxyribose-phosphate aldolase